MVHDKEQQLRLHCNDISELANLAKEIIAYGKDIFVWLFEGEMGSGKTTMIKSICSAFGVEDVVSSPTYSLVNEYANDQARVFYHFDFYRLNDEEEAQDIGTGEYFYSGDYCFVEWPSKVPSLLPETYLQIFVEVKDDQTRVIEITRHE